MQYPYLSWTALEKNRWENPIFSGQDQQPTPELKSHNTKKQLVLKMENSIYFILLKLNCGWGKAMLYCLGLILNEKKKYLYNPHACD